MLGGLSGAVLAAAFTLTCRERVYSADASLLFPLPAQSMGASAGVLSMISKTGAEVPTSSAFPLNTYQALLLSQPVLLRVAEKAGIGSLYGLSQPSDMLRRMRSIVEVKIDVDRTVQVSATVPGTVQVRRLADLLHRQGARQRDDKYRALSQRIVQLTVEEMRALADRLEVDSDKASLASSTRSLELAEQALVELRARYATLQSRAKVLEPESYAGTMTATLLRSRDQLAQLDVEVRGTRSELAHVTDFLAKASVQAEKLPIDLPLLSGLREDNRKATIALAKAQQQFGPESPAVLAAKADVDRLHEELARAVGMTQRGYHSSVIELKTKLSALLARRNEVAGLVAQLESQTKRLPPALGELIQVQRALIAQGQQIAMLKDKQMEARSRYETSGLRWSVLNPPFEPTRKSGPSTILALATGFMMGLCLAVASVSRAIYGHLFDANEAGPPVTAA